MDRFLAKLFITNVLVGFVILCLPFFFENAVVDFLYWYGINAVMAAILMVMFCTGFVDSNQTKGEDTYLRLGISGITVMSYISLIEIMQQFEFVVTFFGLTKALGVPPIATYDPWDFLAYLVGIILTGLMVLLKLKQQERKG